MADPVPGLGIAVPIFMSVLVTAIVAVILSRDELAPLAYIAGSLGTLIGADLTNRCVASARRWPRSAVPELLTAYS